MPLMPRILANIRAYFGRLSVAAGLSALHALASGVLVWLSGPLLMTLFGVDSALRSQKSTEPGSASALTSVKSTLQQWVDSLVAGASREETLVNFCWALIVVVLLINVFSYFQGFFMAYVQQSIIRRFRNQLFEKYQRLSLDYFHKFRTGQLMSRVTNDVIVLNDAIDTAFNRLVTDSILVIVLTTFLVILSWQLTLLALVVLPFAFYFIWFIGNKLRKYSTRAQERMADVTSVLEETVSNIRIVKAFSMEDFESKKFYSATTNYFRALLRMTRVRNLAAPVSDILATLAGATILYLAGTRIVGGTGNMTPGDFLTFIFAMFSLIKPVKSLSHIHVRLQEGRAAAERIYSVLDAPETVRERATPVSLDQFRSVVRYDHVSFRYLPGEPVLDDISFELRCGEVVAIVGPSGAGKSTLVDLLPRFYDPQAGTISIDAIDIRDLSLASLRGLMGIVTQETLLFNDTIERNIAYGQSDISRDKIVEAASAANAHQFICGFEAGYDTVVGSRGVRLSGGQRQRIAIARALLKNPQILIFDEATSALDTESETLVQQAIDRLMKNRTALVIAHRLSTIKNADRILVLDKGKIVEHGSHVDLLKHEGLYHRLYTMQFRESVV